MPGLAGELHLQGTGTSGGELLHLPVQKTKVSLFTPHPKSLSYATSEKLLSAVLEGPSLPQVFRLEKGRQA